MGLVDEVVPASEVYTAARARVARYVGGPAYALRAAKEAIDRGLELDLESGLEVERMLFTGLFATKDRATGMRSFVEQGPGKATFEGAWRVSGITPRRCRPIVPGLRESTARPRPPAGAPPPRTKEEDEARMNIVVCVKYVPDAQSDRTFRDSDSTVDREGVDGLLSELDEYAIEEALKVVEAAGEGEVTVLTVGPPAAADAIKKALQMGADKGVHVRTRRSTARTPLRPPSSSPRP